MHDHARRIRWALAAFAALAAACATTPQSNSALEQARAAYEAARNDAAAAEAAPVVLDKAENELEQAESLFEDGGDAELVDHHAYLALRQSEIAIARGRVAVAESQVAAADAQRQEVLLEARTRDARRSEERAEARALEAAAALSSAEQSAQQAAAAQARAEQLQAEAVELQSQLQELQAKPTPRGLVLTLGDVLFDTAEAQLKPGADRALNELVEFMEEYPERNVMIEGFTDARGGETYNLGLSERRADAVESALIAEGIDQRRIRSRGFGEAYPVASNETDAGRQLNRRVEVIISDDAGNIPERGPESAG